MNHDAGKVWCVFPTANAPLCDTTLRRWKSRGYLTAVLIDGATTVPQEADHVLRADLYRGYPATVNSLCWFLDKEYNPNWIIAAGDDIYPDENHDPAEIAAECLDHFGGTFGVMQPCGDRFGALIEREALTCPWMGRDWRRRVNGGCGPLWEEYEHLYDDAEHCAVAEKLGRIWWREDLTQYHDHRDRRGDPMPAYIAAKGNVGARSKAIFERRRAAGFPGHEPST